MSCLINNLSLPSVLCLFHVKSNSINLLHSPCSLSLSISLPIFWTWRSQLNISSSDSFLIALTVQEQEEALPASAFSFENMEFKRDNTVRFLIFIKNKVYIFKKEKKKKKKIWILSKKFTFFFFAFAIPKKFWYLSFFYFCCKFSQFLTFFSRNIAFYWMGVCTNYWFSEKDRCKRDLQLSFFFLSHC